MKNHNSNTYTPWKYFPINQPLTYGKPKKWPFLLSQSKWKIWVFPCPAWVGYCNSSGSRRRCWQPSPSAWSLLKSEGCRWEVEVCHGDYRGSSDLNKYLSSFHKRKWNKMMWKTSEWAQSTVTSPAYKAALHTLLQSVLQSSPHCRQPRKVLLLYWEPPRILWLVKCFLTYLLGVCEEVKMTITSLGERCIIWTKYDNTEIKKKSAAFCDP